MSNANLFTILQQIEDTKIRLENGVRVTSSREESAVLRNADYLFWLRTVYYFSSLDADRKSSYGLD